MNRTQHAHLNVAALSHAGRSGKNNEDRYAVASFTAEDGQPVIFAVVADGIGGHRAGEVAAELALMRAAFPARSTATTPRPATSVSPVTSPARLPVKPAALPVMLTLAVPAPMASSTTAIRMTREKIKLDGLASGRNIILPACRKPCLC